MGFVGDLVGGIFGGDEGQSAPLVINKINKEAELEAENRAGVAGQASVADALRMYGEGKLSADEALNYARNNTHFNWGRKGVPSEFRQLLAIDPSSARRFAEEAVMSSDPAQQLYGKDSGLLSVLGKESGGLADQIAALNQQGFKLNEDDMTAYGQVAGDIARRSGQQEAELANILAQRGLSSSGSAGAGFSGLAGNKFEQLARAQTNIANQRYDRAMNRYDQLQRAQVQNRALQGTLGQQYESSIQGQRDRNMQGVQMGRNQLQEQADRNYRNRAAYQQQLNTMLGQQQATESPSLFETLGTGIKAGVGGAAKGVTGSVLGGLFG